MKQIGFLRFYDLRLFDELIAKITGQEDEQANISNNEPKEREIAVGIELTDNDAAA